MSPTVELHWPTALTERRYGEVHRVVHDVAAAGGAIGWQVPPGPAETRAWADSVLAGAGGGESGMCLALVDGTVEGLGCWQRDRSQVLRHTADLVKVMAHPTARGLGLGRLVTAAVIDAAEAAGIETLRLAVRGNNRLAIALYEELGFREWGRLPDVIEVGDLRFDEVRMYRKLAVGPHVVLRGSGPGGPGASPDPSA